MQEEACVMAEWQHYIVNYKLSLVPRPIQCYTLDNGTLRNWVGLGDGATTNYYVQVTVVCMMLLI